MHTYNFKNYMIANYLHYKKWQYSDISDVDFSYYNKNMGKIKQFDNIEIIENFCGKKLSNCTTIIYTIIYSNIHILIYKKMFVNNNTTIIGNKLMDLIIETTKYIYNMFNKYENNIAIIEYGIRENSICYASTSTDFEIDFIIDFYKEILLPILENKIIKTINFTPIDHNIKFTYHINRSPLLEEILLEKGWTKAQPHQIATFSMWDTYNGETIEATKIIR